MLSDEMQRKILNQLYLFPAEEKKRRREEFLSKLYDQVGVIWEMVQKEDMNIRNQDPNGLIIYSKTVWGDALHIKGVISSHLAGCISNLNGLFTQDLVGLIGPKLRGNIKGCFGVLDPRLEGYISEASGDFTGLYGCMEGSWRDILRIHGSFSGDVSDIGGDVTGIEANVQKDIMPILMTRQKRIDTQG